MSARVLYLLAAATPYVAAALIVSVYLLTYWTAVATLAAAAIAVVAVQLFRIPTRVVLIVTMAIALVLVVGSGSAIAALVVLALTAVAYGLGARIVGDGVAPTAGERSAYALVVGYGVLSLFCLALAVFGALSWPVATAGLAVAAAASRGSIADGFARSVTSARALFTRAPAGPLVVLVCISAIAVLAHALTPEVESDALSYHLGLNREYLAAGALVDRPEQPQSYYYRAADMDFLLAMLFGGQIAAKILSALAIALGAQALWAFGSDVVSPRAARLAAVLFVFTPVMLWSAATTYVDGIVSVLAFIAVAAMYRAAAAPTRRGLVVAGLLAAVAVSTKLTVLIVLAPAGAWLIWKILVRREDQAARLASFTASALVMVAPWPLLIFVRTGNPIFPFLNTIFHSALWPEVNESFDLVRYGVHGWQSLLAPIFATYDASAFSDEFVGPVIGLAILFAPLARPRPVRSLLLLAGFGGCLIWALTFQYLRYLMPVVPILGLLAGDALDRILEDASGASRALARAIPAVVAAAGLVFFLGTFHGWPDDLLVPYGTALGIQPARDYLDRRLPTYEPLQYLAGTDGASSRVLIASCQGENDDQDRLYAPGRIESCESPWARALYRMRNDDEVIQALRERGITHVLLLAHGVRGDVIDSPVVRPSFLEAHGRLEYQRGAVRLYRLLM